MFEGGSEPHSGNGAFLAMTADATKVGRTTMKLTEISGFIWIEIVFLPMNPIIEDPLGVVWFLEEQPFKGLPFIFTEIHFAFHITGIP
jgi:hypothetical protein